MELNLPLLFIISIYFTKHILMLRLYYKENIYLNFEWNQLVCLYFGIEKLQ